MSNKDIFFYEFSNVIFQCCYHYKLNFIHFYCIGMAEEIKISRTPPELSACLHAPFGKKKYVFI